jgi:hypothetical protein
MRRTIARYEHFGVLALLSAVVVTGCAAASAADAANRVAYGTPVTLGQGIARTYVTMENGKATEIGIALSEGALKALPADGDPGGIPLEGHSMFEYVLSLPEGNGTAFRHAVVNWNPAGHEPHGVYNRPHFDFHFYTISNAERVAIDPEDPEFEAKATNTPAPDAIPARYILPAPHALPQMGVHWIDTSSVELKGAPFTKTFIFGSYDGKVIFAEPMITKAFLESKPQFTASLPAPPRGRAEGFYPESYSIRWDASSKEYRITLVGLGQ